jgi:hypothetical protein
MPFQTIAKWSTIESCPDTPVPSTTLEDTVNNPVNIVHSIHLPLFSVESCHSPHSSIHTIVVDATINLFLSNNTFLNLPKLGWNNVTALEATCIQTLTAHAFKTHHFVKVSFGPKTNAANSNMVAWNIGINIDNPMVTGALDLLLDWAAYQNFQGVIICGPRKCTMVRDPTPTSNQHWFEDSQTYTQHFEFGHMLVKSLLHYARQKHTLFGNKAAPLSPRGAFALHLRQKHRQSRPMTTSPPGTAMVM